MSAAEAGRASAGDIVRTLILPGLERIRLPLPFALDHVHCWLADADDGSAVLIDTGAQMAGMEEVWEDILDRLPAGRRISRLIVTHFHPDHLGMAWWLSGRLGLAVEMSQREWLAGRLYAVDQGVEARQRDYDFFAACGAPQWYLSGLSQESGRRTPASYRRLSRGDRLRFAGLGWQVMTAPGHSPEMLTFYSADGGVLLAGDHLLGRISPHVGAFPSEPLADPLAVYLASLTEFAELPAGTLVLPSHGGRFHDPPRRCRELAAHHDARCARILDHVRTPLTCYEIACLLYGERLRTPHDIYLGLAEVVAHVNHLERQERLEVTRAGPPHRVRARE